MKPTRRPSVSLVSETGMFLWMPSLKSAVFCFCLSLPPLVGGYGWQRWFISLESFVCQTTYRWSDFTLSINKEARYCWTWIKPAIAGGIRLWYWRVFNAANFCLRLLVLSRFSIFLTSWFIDNVKSYLYVVWQTNDPNDTRLSCW